MSFRTTGVLLAVLLVLGLFVYFFEMQRPRSAESDKDKALELFNYAGQSVNLLEVKQGEKVTRLVSKEGEGWTMEAPEKAPADRVRVIPVVGEMTMLRASTLISEDPNDLPKYGLDKPALVVSLGIKDRDFQRLLIGMEAPTKTGYYVKLAESKKIFLLGGNIVESLRKLVTEPPKAQPTPTPQPTLAPAAQPTATPAP